MAKQRKTYDLSTYGKKILWLDVETTGLNPEKDVVVQLAAILMVDGVKTDMIYFDLICPPDASILKTPEFLEAAEVTGLTEAKLMAAGVMPYEQARKEFAEFVWKHVKKFDSTDKLVFAGYNPRFDMDFMKKFWPDKYFYGSFWVYPFDVLPFSIEAVRRSASIGAPVPKSMRLGDIAAWLEVPAEGVLHNAMTDIELTINLADRLMEKFFYGGREDRN